MPEPVKVLELYLVRHGESMSNCGADGDLCDELKYDPPLSEKGVREAELLGEYFSGLKLDCVLCSGMRRALKTAYEVCSRQPADGAVNAEVHGIFTECGTSEKTRGRSVNEIRRDFSCMNPAEGTTEDELQIYYSENDDDEALLQRARTALEYIRNRFRNGERVMVAAHAAFDTFVVFAALGLKSEQIFDPSFYNTGITKIDFFQDGTGAFADVHLVYHNAVPHLLKEFPEFKF